MTARWSGVFLARNGDVAPARRISKANASGLPQALGGKSPKRVFLLRVLVTRTSVVEMSSTHLGGAPKECRKANECPVPKGSRHPRQGPSPSNREGGRPGRGRKSFSKRKGARWDSKLERESVKATDLGAQRSKDPSSPLVGNAGESLAPNRESSSLSRQGSIKLMEGAWDPELGGAKPAFKKSRSRLHEHGTANI